MTRFSLRLGACAFALLALSACDSTGPEDPTTPPVEQPPVQPPAASPLVGSWSLGESTTETLLTVNQNQLLVDASGPVTGSVAITGAETATLRYMQVNVSDTYSQASLTSYDPYGPTYSPVRYELRLAPDYVSLSVYRDNGQSDQYAFYGNTTPFTYVDGRLTVQPLTLQNAYGNGTTVRIGAGALAFPTRPLQAGQETVVRTFTDRFGDDPFGDTVAIRYVFEAGGVYRAERDFYPNRTISYAGTWSEDGTRLRLSIVDGNVTESETFGYTLTDGALRLGSTADNCRANSFCLRDYERSFGLRSETVTRVATRSTMTLAPTVATAPRPGRPAAGAPAGVVQRREAAVWPRALAQTDASL